MASWGRKLAFAAGTACIFSCHPLMGGYNGSSPTPNNQDSGKFPVLGSHQFPPCFTEPPELAHLGAITGSVLAGTFGWVYIRCGNSSIRKKMGIRCTAALAGLMVFDLASWYWRLRIYGVKAGYFLREDNFPHYEERTKFQNEVLWYRCNQVVVPIVLAVGGHITGVLPFLLVPIVTWKAFLHFWVLYQDIHVFLGRGPMSCFKELEDTLGRDTALEYYCEYKKLDNTVEASSLYDIAIEKE